jgi:hypothetical protein
MKQTGSAADFPAFHLARFQITPDQFQHPMNVPLVARAGREPPVTSVISLFLCMSDTIVIKSKNSSPDIPATLRSYFVITTG